MNKQIYHPLLGTTRNLGNSPDSMWMEEFLLRLREKRKVALRLGTLDVDNTVYTLKYEAVKKLCSGKVTVEDLNETDFEITMRQKGVDMKIGVDIASIAYKKQVEQIVLIAGDADFVPAAKLARREGIDFILDPMQMNIGPGKDLFEHIDGKRSCGCPYNSNDGH